MKKIFSSTNLGIVANVKNLLENQGIITVMKNYYLLGAMGEVPPGECWPELWILDDNQYEDALALIKENQSASSEPSPPWLCNSCGELLEGQFTQCWKCGNSLK